MSFAFIVWAIGTLPAIGGAMTFIGFIFTIATVTIKVIALTEGQNLPILRYLSITLPMLCIGAVIPDKETAYAMAGAYGIQTVVEDERVQRIAGQGVDVLEAFLEKTKKDLEK